MIDIALRLGFFASEAEQSMRGDSDIPRETISEMLQMVCKAHDWAQNTMRLVDWLGMLLTISWGFQGASAERLREFIINSKCGVDDYIELTLGGVDK